MGLELTHSTPNSCYNCSGFVCVQGSRSDATALTVWQDTVSAVANIQVFAVQHVKRMHVCISVWMYASVLVAEFQCFYSASWHDTGQACRNLIPRFIILAPPIVVGLSVYEESPRDSRASFYNTVLSKLVGEAHSVMNIALMYIVMLLTSSHNICWYFPTCMYTLLKDYEVRWYDSNLKLNCSLQTTSEYGH